MLQKLCIHIAHFNQEPLEHNFIIMMYLPVVVLHYWLYTLEYMIVFR